MNPASGVAREAIIKAGVLINGHFVYADGDHSDNKLEMDRLWDNPAELELILEQLSTAEGLPSADLIIGVPTGGQRLAEAIGPILNLPVARLEKVPGRAKQDFRFRTTRDLKLARDAKSPRIYEDVVTTLSSIAGVVKLLDPSRQDIQALAIWRRGQVKPHYEVGVTDHYLVEELLPSYPPEACRVCR